MEGLEACRVPDLAYCLADAQLALVVHAERVHVAIRIENQRVRITGSCFAEPYGR